MKIRSRVAAANIGFMFLLVLGIKAEAAELKVLSAIGMQSVLEDLGPKFERATGHKLAITFATLGATVKGGFVRGPEAVRAYWTEQWSEINPCVEPIAFYPEDAGQVLVEVHQVVRDLAGAVLADEHVGHRFTIEHGLIQAMEVCPLPSSGLGA